MNIITDLLSSDIIYALGWTLIHSIWQGAVVAVILAFLLLFTKNFTAQSRYIIASLALLLVLMISIATFFKFQSGEANRNFSDAGNSGYLLTTDKLNEPGLIKIDSNAGKANETGTGFFAGFKDYFDRNIPLIVTVWFLGLIILILKFIGGFAYNQRLKSYKTEPLQKVWRDRLEEFCRQTGITRSVKLLGSSLVKVPAVIGHLRPVILLPLGVVDNLPPGQVETIIIHELAHILRHDYFVNIMQHIVDILYFYHPGVRWISAQIRTEREHSCDDIAISISGDSMTFANALASLHESEEKAPAMAQAIYTKPKRLFGRIKRMIRIHRLNSTFTEGFTTAFVLAFFVILLFGCVYASDQTKGIRGSKELTSQEMSSIEAVPEYEEGISIEKIILTDASTFRYQFLVGNADWKPDKVYAWIKNNLSGSYEWTLFGKDMTAGIDYHQVKNIIQLAKGSYKFVVRAEASLREEQWNTPEGKIMIYTERAGKYSEERDLESEAYENANAEIEQQIADLEDEIAGIETDRRDIEAEIEDLKAEKADSESEAKRMQAEVERAKADIDKKQKELARLADDNKKLAAEKQKIASDKTILEKKARLDLEKKLKEAQLEREEAKKLAVEQEKLAKEVPLKKEQPEREEPKKLAAEQEKLAKEVPLKKEQPEKGELKKLAVEQEKLAKVAALKKDEAEKKDKELEQKVSKITEGFLKAMSELEIIDEGVKEEYEMFPVEMQSTRNRFSVCLNYPQNNRWFVHNLDMGAPEMKMLQKDVENIIKKYDIEKMADSDRIFIAYDSADIIMVKVSIAGISAETAREIEKEIAEDLKSIIR